MKVQPHLGFDIPRFPTLLDSEEGCPATDEHLTEALIHHLRDRERGRAAVELFVPGLGVISLAP